MPQAEITILLSTWNGERFLPDLLRSLAAQSVHSFSLLVRDDGSSDGSAALIERWNGAVTRLPSNGENLGAAASYGKLLRAATGRYLMFADQDDFWRPDKIARTLAHMKRLEACCKESTPLLVHTDLRVCGPELEPVAPSLFRYQALNPARSSLRDLMIQNNVTGCTMMINRALADQVEIPPEAICHDWYLAMAAAALGRVEFLDEALVDYRQHDRNVYGAIRYGRQVWKAGLHPKRLRHRLELTQLQARAFLRQYGQRLSAADRELLSAWSGIGSRGKLHRLYTCLKYGFRKNTPLRTFGMWWAV